jgi:hypothetical protein
MHKDFFMACYDTGLPTLHGPFATFEELEKAGEKWQAEHDGDPRWQSLRLTDEEAARWPGRDGPVP